MPDLASMFLGLPLRNPLVVSASPLSRSLDTVRKLEDAGAAAIVLYSLFEEQITHESLELDHYLQMGTHSYAESLTFFPDLDTYNVGVEPYLEHLRQVKRATSIPIIGSLNGVSTGGWVEYARKIQDAGADALELNIYFVPADPDRSGAELEEMYLTLARDVIADLTIPVTVKLSPFFTSLPHIARQFTTAGARGLTLFNRFYQPDLDIEELVVTPHLVLSTSSELRLPLRWIAMLYGRVRADLALTTGVHNATDAIKAVMAGASAVMMASELLAHGPQRLSEILVDIERWMEEREYDSILQMRGSMSQRSVSDPAAFERANYMKTLNSFATLP
ncbi:MAG TPA: dihydroorotate dehydrogenase-like protein [Ktedonobacterales bacterium]